MTVAAFGLALLVLHRSLGQYHYRDVVAEFHRVPWSAVVGAVLLTAIGYWLLTGYDVLALRYLGRPLPYRRVVLASFTSYAFTNNIGMSWLVGGPLRYRLYSGWDIGVGEVARVMAFCAGTFWLGFLSVAGVMFVLEPPVCPPQLHLPLASLRLLGCLFVLLVALYLAWCWRSRAPLRIGRFEVSPPPFRLALCQTALGVLDWLTAAAVLYVLLPPDAAVSYPGLVGIFAVAQLAGVVSNVPGGLGVFESIVLMFLVRQVPASTAAGALLAFRLIYYLLPLVVAVALLGVHEAVQRRGHIEAAARALGEWVSILLPPVFAVAVMGAGTVLLVSGAVPSGPERIRWLTQALPLAVLETSHFLASAVGALLLVLGRALMLRVDGAYVMAVGLLSAGMVLSLLKGLAWEESLVLGIVLAALIPCRRHFYRRAAVWDTGLTPAWTGVVVLAVCGSAWLGVFAYKHVPYAHALWFDFGASGDAPRFLRATAGVLVVVLALWVARLLRPAPPEPAAPDDEEMARVRPLIAASPVAAANLALLRDKSLLFSDNGRAMVMYAVSGPAWVAMGDPVGDAAEFRELVWRFRELADQRAGLTVFYEVGTAHLPLYLDLGLTLWKLGEEAQVPVQGFSLEGSHRKSFRHLCRRLEQDGCRFEILPPEKVREHMPALQAVSDAWLAAKNVREKGFSLGFFSPEYLANFPVAVILRDQEVLAFANLWLGAGKEEFSMDLMRFRPGVADGLMDYLIVQLLAWGKAQGYQRFNLGMAPLAGMEEHALAPLRTRLGAIVFRHGEHFYNFQGLHQYKQKFDPEWQPRYLASPGGWATARVLSAVAALIAGGVRGILAK